MLRLAGMKTDDLEEAVTEEEIKAMLEMGSEAGVFNKEERDMINSVFSFDDKLARDVMIPRRDVFAIDLSEPFEAYIDEVLESRHSRIPTYERFHDRDAQNGMVGSGYQSTDPPCVLCSGQ